MLTQYFTHDLTMLLKDPNPLVHRGAIFLINAPELQKLCDADHTAVTHGFCAALELAKLIADQPIVRLYALIANYHVLGLLLKKRQEKPLDLAENALTEAFFQEMTLLCMQQTLFNLSVYGHYMENIDQVLPVFLKIAPKTIHGQKETKTEILHTIMKELQVEKLEFRYHPQLRHNIARIGVKNLDSYWTLTIAIEGLLRAKNIPYTDPVCPIDTNLEEWLSQWSQNIPSEYVIVSIDEMKDQNLSAKYFLVVSPMTASDLRLQFGKYGVSERIRVWNHGANF